MSVLLSLPILAISGGDRAQARHARGLRQRGRRLVLRHVSRSGRDIISCRAPHLRLDSAWLLLIPLVVIALARIDETRHAIAFGRDR